MLPDRAQPRVAAAFFLKKKTYLVKNKMLSSFCVEMVVISRVKKSEKEFAN